MQAKAIDTHVIRQPLSFPAWIAMLRGLSSPCAYPRSGIGPCGSQDAPAGQGEKVAPEHKEMVSVYFSDIVGFTSLSSTISSAKVAAAPPPPA